MNDIALIALAVIFVLTGLTKLAGVQMMRANFERFGLPDSARLAIGAVEIGLAVLAVIGLGSETTAIVAAAGALMLMVGALATHVRVKDGPDQYVAPVIVTVAAVVALVTL